MRRIIVLLIAAGLGLSACAPMQPTATATGDWSMSGSCTIDQSGWEISYDKSSKRTTFVLWIEGGECDTD